MTNKELAEHLRNLHAFLVIAGYDEMAARRYIHIASEVEDLEEEVDDLRKEGRLREIQGVGPAVAGYLKEILETGRSSKQQEWEKVVPFRVVELVKVSGLGHKTARKLYSVYGISTLQELRAALDSGRLDEAPGIGQKTLERWKESVARRLGS